MMKVDIHGLPNNEIDHLNDFIFELIAQPHACRETPVLSRNFIFEFYQVFVILAAADHSI